MSNLCGVPDGKLNAFIRGRSSFTDSLKPIDATDGKPVKLASDSNLKTNFFRSRLPRNR